MGDEAPAALHLRHDQVGGLPPVELVRALGCDPAQGLGQFRLAEDIAERGRLPVLRQELGGARREPPEQLDEPLVVRVQEPLVHLEAVGEGDRRLHQRRPREPPEARVELPHSRDGAGSGHRAVADQHVLGDVPLGVQVHVAVGGERRPAAEVERHRFAVGHPHHQEPVAGDVAGFRIHHRERERNRDRRIGGVAARLQDLDADLARQRIGRDHHAVVGDDRVARPVVPPARGEAALGSGRIGGRPGAGSKQRQGAGNREQGLRRARRAPRPG